MLRVGARPKFLSAQSADDANFETLGCSCLAFLQLLFAVHCKIKQQKFKQSLQIANSNQPLPRQLLPERNFGGFYLVFAISRAAWKLQIIEFTHRLFKWCAGSADCQFSTTAFSVWPQPWQQTGEGLGAGWMLFLLAAPDAHTRQFAFVPKPNRITRVVPFFYLYKSICDQRALVQNCITCKEFCWTMQSFDFFYSFFN